MSVDDFMAVLHEEGGKWVGYHCSASMQYPQQTCYRCLGTRRFRVDSMKDAIIECQQFDEGGYGYLEYGYFFVNPDSELPDIDLDLCDYCPQRQQKAPVNNQSVAGAEE